MRAQGLTFVVVGFVEGPGPNRFLQKTVFREMQFRRDARPDFPPLDPLGSPLGVLGSPLGPRALVPLGFLFGSLWLPLGPSSGTFGSPLGGLGPPLVPLGHLFGYL